MDIISSTPTNDNLAIATTDPGAWLAGLDDLSAVSPSVAITRPLADLVAMTLTEAGGESAHTQRAYQTAIGLFLAWLGQHHAARVPREWQPLAVATRRRKQTVWEFRGPAAVLRLVTAGTLGEFNASLASGGNGKATRDLRRRAVNTFLRLALREGVLTQAQALNMGLTPYKRRERRDVKPTGRRLTREEVRALRWTIATGRPAVKAARDLAIVDCMLYAGLRRSEVAGLTTGSLRMDGGRWWLVLTGKGSKTRRVKVHDMLYKSLEAWARCAGLTLGEGETVLFGNLAKGGRMTGNGLTASVIGRIVAEYGAKAGLAPASGPNVLSPHDLRRTAARNAYDNGAPLPRIQAMLGHADVKTTMLYIGADEDDTATAVDRIEY